MSVIEAGALTRAAQGTDALGPSPPCCAVVRGPSRVSATRPARVEHHQEVTSGHRPPGCLAVAEERAMVQRVLPTADDSDHNGFR